MAVIPKKMGRKSRPFICPWNNETIDGLYLCKDGRWRINETQKKFSEADPKRAVARFRQWQAQQRGDQRMIPLPFHSLATAVSPTASQTERSAAHARLESLVREVLGSGDHLDGKDDSLTLRIPKGSGPVEWLRAIPAEVYYACVAEDIMTKPKLMAERTGIEQLAYLPTMTKPEASPTLEAIGEFFFAKKTKLSKDWRGKCRAFWTEFQTLTGAKTLRDITLNEIDAYEVTLTDLVEENDYGPPYIRQRLEAIRSIINFSHKKKRAVTECQRVDGLLKTIEKPAANDAAPKPISPKNFRLLLSGAEGETKAILLLALNCCMYGGEVAALRWEELNLEKRTFIASRPKNGVVRVAILWKRTVEALKALPRTSEAVFLTNATKMQHNYSTVYALFKKLRSSLGLKGVQISHIRDGAYTTACESSRVNALHAEVLAGHQTGIKDRYVKRRPRIVLRACQVIEREYFPEDFAEVPLRSGDRNGKETKPITDGD